QLHPPRRHVQSCAVKEKTRGTTKGWRQFFQFNSLHPLLRQIARVRIDATSPDLLFDFGYDLIRRTSCGQPHASASLPAQCLAACSSATSITLNPPRNWGFGTYGPLVNINVPLVASAQKAAAGSSSKPRQTHRRPPPSFLPRPLWP